MRLNLIAAVAANRVIGRENGLPWHLSADLKHFQALTMGHHLLMGRRTFDSIGRALPGRTTVVISRDAGFSGNSILIAASIERALEIAAADDEIFVCGGAQIYEQMLHRADRMFITQVHADVTGDAFFPDFDDVAEWKLVDREDFESDQKNDHPFSFLTYVRAGAEVHAIPEEG